jgi:hypothetical protein
MNLLLQTINCCIIRLIFLHPIDEDDKKKSNGFTVPCDNIGKILYWYYLPPNIFPITGILASGFAELLSAGFGLDDCCWLAAV